MGFQLADCFERVADTVPAAAAVVDPRSSRTYAQLDRRANQLAHALHDLGVRADDTIAVVLPNRIEHLETLLAAWKLGAVPVNVNTRYTADEVAYVLTNSQARAVVVDERHARTLSRAHEALATLVVDDSDSSSYEVALSHHASARPAAPRKGSDRYVLYTGGTTGLPKGAVWRHDDIFFGALGGRDIDGNQLVHSLDELAEFAARDAGTERVFIACPLMHGTAQWMALRTLFRGGTALLDGSPSFDPDMTWKRVHATSATAMVITGDAFAQPLSEALVHGAVIPTALNVIYSGGARLTPSVARTIVEEIESVIVVDGYGSTEAGGLGLALYVDGAPDPIGFRVGPDVAVLNDAGEPIALATDAEGQLAYAGRLPLEYLHDADATAERFVASGGRRWYLTGDVGRVEADGTVSVLGRVASSINTGGEKVYPEEIEAALLAHPMIADAIVFSVPDARFGERIEAAVVLARGVQLPADVDPFLRARLAGFKIPRDIQLVDAIPRTAAGKLDREAASRQVRA
jgi:acyl-CoA synthetase (AMP-forming)/AMP-acid ligase II